MTTASRSLNRLRRVLCENTGNRLLDLVVAYRNAADVAGARGEVYATDDAAWLRLQADNLFSAVAAIPVARVYLHE